MLSWVSGDVKKRNFYRGIYTQILSRKLQNKKQLIMHWSTEAADSIFKEVVSSFAVHQKYVIIASYSTQENEMDDVILVNSSLTQPRIFKRKKKKKKKKTEKVLILQT